MSLNCDFVALIHACPSLTAKFFVFLALNPPKILISASFIIEINPSPVFYLQIEIAEGRALPAR
jgi:hypothetical protein